MSRPAAKAVARRTREAVVLVESPRFTVVEGEAPADPSALVDAFRLLVAWAVQEHMQAQALPEPPGAQARSDLNVPEDVALHAVPVCGSED